MLASHKIMAFAPTLDANKARPFYEGVLGLSVVSQHNFALALDAHGIMLRVTNVPPSFKPQPFTILGWQVPDVAETVSALKRKGVHFESYGLPTQDAEGIWCLQTACSNREILAAVHSSLPPLLHPTVDF